jgi:hypothetical protein
VGGGVETRGSSSQIDGTDLRKNCRCILMCHQAQLPEILYVFCISCGTEKITAIISLYNINWLVYITDILPFRTQ